MTIAKTRETKDELWCQICGRKIKQSETEIGYYCKFCVEYRNDWGLEEED